MPKTNSISLKSCGLSLLKAVFNFSSCSFLKYISSGESVSISTSLIEELKWFSLSLLWLSRLLFCLNWVEVIMQLRTVFFEIFNSFAISVTAYLRGLSFCCCEYSNATFRKFWYRLLLSICTLPQTVRTYSCQALSALYFMSCSKGISES